MYGPGIGPIPDEAGADLHQAARVSSRHKASAGGSNVLELTVQNEIRCFRLDKVVDPRRPAALIGLMQRNEFQPGNR